MGFFNVIKKKRVEGFKDTHIKTAGELFVDALKFTSGTSHTRTLKYKIFHQFIGFRGICDGLGTSLIVSNVAIALAKYGLRVCVVDTSIVNSVQDFYLKTGVSEDESNAVDWFDLALSDKNVLHTSKISGNISVLSFVNRGILDLLSVSDTSDLVSVAFKDLTANFDIVLVDICNEPSEISTTAMQLSHTIYQVWGNDTRSLVHIDDFVKNLCTLACTPDKMKYIITSNTIDDIRVTWESIYKRYNFKELSHVGNSPDIARTTCTGETLFGMASKSEGIEEFNECIADICARILGLDINQTSGVEDGLLNAIVDGKVEGTLTNKVQTLTPEEQEFVEQVQANTAHAIKEMDDLGDYKSEEIDNKISSSIAELDDKASIERKIRDSHKPLVVRFSPFNKRKGEDK